MPRQHKESRLAQIIPGITHTSDVERILGKGEQVNGNWVIYNPTSYPERGIKNVYFHYDENSDKVDGLYFDLEQGILSGSDVKMIYYFEDISPETVVKNNRLTCIYKLKEPLVLAITHTGPIESTPVYSLAYLTKDAYTKGLLSKLPSATIDINGEWFVEDEAGNYPVYLYQQGEFVSGIYGYAGGILYGKIKGADVDFTWRQDENKVGGSAHFTLTSDGKILIGTWDYDPAVYASGQTGGGAWVFHRRE